eukprot:664585-Amphidinium_carterae.1
MHDTTHSSFQQCSATLNTGHRFPSPPPVAALPQFTATLADTCTTTSASSSLTAEATSAAAPQPS